MTPARPTHHPPSPVLPSTKLAALTLGPALTLDLPALVDPARLAVFWQLSLLACAVPLGAVLVLRLLIAHAPVPANQNTPRPQQEHRPPSPPAGMPAPNSSLSTIPPTAPADIPIPAPASPNPEALAEVAAPLPINPSQDAPAEHPGDGARLTFFAGQSPRPSSDPSVEARRRRIDAARGREQVRAALSMLADAGFFVFEDVVTAEAGAVDQLVVGPTGVHPVLVLPHRGYVFWDDSGRLAWSKRKATPDTPDSPGTYYQARWDENPEEIMDALRKDLAHEVIHKGVGSIPVYCFTEATILAPDDLEGPTQATSPFDVVRLLRDTDPEPHGYLRPDGPHIREIARLVARNYKRLPWAVPPEHDAFAASLRDEL